MFTIGERIKKLRKLVYGVERSQHFDISKGLSEVENEFILQSRKLKLEDQDEILEFIKLKINRYNKKRL